MEPFKPQAVAKEGKRSAISVEFTGPLLEQLKTAARQANMPQVSFIRAAVEYAINNMENK